MEAFVFMLLLLVIGAVAGTYSERKRIAMKVKSLTTTEQLENRLNTLLITWSDVRSTEENALALRDAMEESKAIARELKRRTGKEYKDLARVMGEIQRERKEALLSYQVAKEGGHLPQKPASVAKRAVIGGIVAGQAGAIVGAISAADENNRNKTTE